MLTCAFTGHRKIKPEHLSALPEMLYGEISRAYDLGCRRFIAGGALGFDTEAARQVIRFRLSHPDVYLSIYVPHIGQSDLWTNQQKSLYDYILAASDEVKYVSENYDKDCMRRRNEAMAKDCDILIAYVYSAKSGAGQTCRYAQHLGKEIHNIFPDA
jgi:uncharacterized phage-like protein YoqJ